MRQGGRYLRFYSLVMGLNSAAIAMFLIISTPPPVQIMSDEYPVTTPIVRAISGTPQRIVVPTLDIDLPVRVGSYDQVTGGWTLSNAETYYADASVPANDTNGVTLIYGHDLTSIFGNLVKLQPGAQVDVYTDTQHVFHYQYQSMRTVEPTDTSSFRVSGPPTLVLQTCTGDWDAYRAMYSFAYLGEAKV